MSTEGGGATRAGGEGLHNEDVFVVEEGLGLYVVCDGASALPGGEIAAKLAAEALEEFIERMGDEFGLAVRRTARAVVARAMVHALRAVEAAEQADPELHGLTTTITMLLAHGRQGVIGHRGDSRAYLIRRDRARQLTVDDELGEAIGDAAAEDFDVFGIELRPGDTIVLCSDGAERALEDRSIVRAAGEISPRLLASRIVSAAHREHSDVDATAVVARICGEAEPGWLELSVPPRRTAFGHTLEYA